MASMCWVVLASSQSWANQVDSVPLFRINGQWASARNFKRETMGTGGTENSTDQSTSRDQTLQKEETRPSTFAFLFTLVYNSQA
jgi:hypothetical protein